MRELLVEGSRTKGSRSLILLSPRWRMSSSTHPPQGVLTVLPLRSSCQNAWLSRSRGPSSIVFSAGWPSGVSGPMP